MNVSNSSFDYDYVAFFKELGLNLYEPIENAQYQSDDQNAMPFNPLQHQNQNFDNESRQDPGGYQSLPGYGALIQNIPLQQQYGFHDQQLPPSYEEAVKKKN